MFIKNLLANYIQQITKAVQNYIFVQNQAPIGTTSPVYLPINIEEEIQKLFKIAANLVT